MFNPLTQLTPDPHATVTAAWRRIRELLGYSDELEPPSLEQMLRDMVTFHAREEITATAAAELTNLDKVEAHQQTAADIVDMLASTVAAAITDAALLEQYTSRYTFGVYNATTGARPVHAERRGPDRWVVVQEGQLLGVDGAWHPDLLYSARDETFETLTRYGRATAIRIAASTADKAAGAVR